MAYTPFCPAVEENSGEYLTDPAGFIPIVEKIEDMIAAGENLNEVRESDYDGSDLDMDVDPTRSLTFDEVDAQRMIDRTSKSLEETLRVRESESRQKKGASKDASSHEDADGNQVASEDSGKDNEG